MADWLVGVAFYVAVVKQLLLLAALGIVVSCADDLFVDLTYGAGRFWRWLTVYSRHAPMRAADLGAVRPGFMAILVPAWDEADVIADMLRASLRRLEYPNYRLFVGVYPNDPATRHAVACVADPRVEIVVTSRPGPTSKADCLNHLYLAALRHAARTGVAVKAFVLHDAEDLVDPQELTVFNHLIPRKAMVQAPVIALPDPGSRWVAGSYMDEFAECHAKDMVVREWLGAGLPSAGVGCAFSADILAQLAAGNGGVPFNETSVTEDYELGVRIGLLGGKAALVRIPGGRGVIATREHFPHTVEAAIRQRARWLLGIALMGWDRLGWQGTLADRYMLWRDRKALLNAVLIVAGYVGLAHIAGLAAAQKLWPAAHAIPGFAPPGSALAWLMVINGALLGWRLALRWAFVTRLYGWREGLRAIPRTLVSNFINARAAFRAAERFAGLARTGGRAAWDKTAHRFPREAA